MTRQRLLAALALVALAFPVPALAQTPPPTPPPPAGSTSGWSNNPITGSFSVSANTDPATGQVNYRVQGTQTTSQGGSQGSSISTYAGGGGGHSACVGETVAQANITFYASGMTLTPQYNGQRLPMVGSVPTNQNADPTAAGYQPLTGSNAIEYIVVCNGIPTGYGMFVPGAGGGPGATTIAAVPTPAQLKTVAQYAEGTITMPTVAIDTSPLTTGLVHLNTWFWATGYTGGQISRTASVLGVSIEVDATPTSYTWDFGDGSPTLQTSSLGVAWQPGYTPNSGTVDCNFDGTPVDTGEPVVPAAITHCYTQTSTGFAVTLTFDLAVSFRVNGGAATPLPPIQRTATLTYPVHEINTVVTSR
jgi:hypothetical protein